MIKNARCRDSGRQVVIRKRLRTDQVSRVTGRQRIRYFVETRDGKVGARGLSFSRTLGESRRNQEKRQQNLQDGQQGAKKIPRIGIHDLEYYSFKAESEAMVGGGFSRERKICSHNSGSNRASSGESANRALSYRCVNRETEARRPASSIDLTNSEGVCTGDLFHPRRAAMRVMRWYQMVAACCGDFSGCDARRCRSSAFQILLDLIRKASRRINAIATILQVREARIMRKRTRRAPESIAS